MKHARVIEKQHCFDMRYYLVLHLIKQALLIIKKHLYPFSSL